MARRFTESFERSSLVRWGTGSDYQLTNALNLDGSTWCGTSIGGTRYGEFNVTAASEYYIGMFYYGGLVNAQPIQWYGSGTQLGYLYVDNSTKELRVFDGTTSYGSGHILTAHIVYHFQVRIKIDNTTGILQVKLDNTLVIDQQNIDSQPGAVTTIDNFRIGLDGGASAQDSICVNDTSGSIDNSWPGIVRMRGLAVIGNGALATGAWSKNTGAAEWDHVEEVPPDNDTTYLSTTSANTYSSFSMADQALTYANYTAMTVSAIAKKDSGTVNLGVGFRIGSSNYIAGVSSSLGTSYGNVEGRLTTDPSTSLSWGSANINAAEAFIFST